MKADISAHAASFTGNGAVYKERYEGGACTFKGCVDIKDGQPVLAENNDMQLGQNYTPAVEPS
ncbi:MAG: hypothetical protein LRZ85_08395 [Alphaproteobacteria bacterium]|nr:hypothetical protein [Alphaproteobacteria bacterium]MCD8525661.1 hypothetical protein [Alphaproteobacteria bacterium]